MSGPLPQATLDSILCGEAAFAWLMLTIRAEHDSDSMADKYITLYQGCKESNYYA